ncbi:hypothetical protein [Streptomyces sp. MZ04]|uniref:hypothetical protein n=1 Tax=Streptomyces sp. MZ04 TaxID=2559236 RepID=UPI00107EDCE7|nr:hypothetical protein [Streptomyces sp. MZ04]TGA90713.1 hypothetical protein E2651_38365 [Streptomyces sp. MZ04]
MKSRSNIARAVIGVTAAAALVALVPNPASAQTVYREKAHATKGSPKIDNHCLSLKTGRENRLVGIACFKKAGNRMWVRDYRKDGQRVEIRGEVNKNGAGYRCYGNYKAGWRKCTKISKKMPNNAVFAWNIALTKKGKVTKAGEMRFSNT